MNDIGHGDAANARLGGAPGGRLTRRALITGVTGQDGSYLAELLLGKGYEVHGLVRRSSGPSTQRIQPLIDANDLRLHEGDMTDAASLCAAVERSRPDEVYNLAAQSHVGASFDVPLATADVTGLGAIRLLEAIRTVGATPRIYQASSSELFGGSPESPQNETTPFVPRSPYACAKAFAFHAVRNYREAYAMHASNGILFNHESPRRGAQFVTRKVTLAAARISLGKQQILELGNLDARRDWGFAGDYVEAMWRMLQQPEPSDFVVATGVSHSVRDLCAVAFASVGLHWQDHVRVSDAHLRPSDVDEVVGDASRAQQVLGWTPNMSFQELIQTMVESDLALLRTDNPPPEP